ncbi:MAG TPA: CapA family protein [Bacteroidales bacterium]|nr:CapA family protein [Bacteroidales bacterium]
MIRIVGDICFADGFFDIGFGVGSKLKGSYDPFEFLPYCEEDIWIGNLECVISGVSVKSGYKSIPFRVPYDRVKSLRHMNIYSVANNHIMQHGVKAFIETINNLEKLGSCHVGSLASQSIKFNFKEKTFGLLAFSQRGEVYSQEPLYWLRPDYRKIEMTLISLKDCDFKIVYMHWGNEFIDYPNVDQKKFARWLVDLGFDLIIGVHPHVLQGFEVYKGKYIFYSLGNFLFNMPVKETRHSAIINLDIVDEALKIGYEYVSINNNVQPVLVSSEEIAAKFLFDTLNLKINFDGDNELYYKDLFKHLEKFRRKNHLWIIRNIYRHHPGEIIDLFESYLKRRI